jgi:succinoglycan biosynthesis protein ExoW
LGKAVDSVLRQTGNFNVRIIVTDDSSPVPATTELAGRIRDNPGRIVIIEQPNGGPAAARNNGLDHVAPGTDHVAFRIRRRRLFVLA